MSEEVVTVENSEAQILTAEYKDGQLQIVEVTPFDKERETGLLPLSVDNESHKYMQVLDTSKGLVQLDLLNLTLVRCEDGENDYQLVTSAGTTDELQSQPVTCVLQTGEVDDADRQESYVVVNDENGQNSLVFLKSAVQEVNDDILTEIQQNNTVTKSRHLTPAEILERAKALQKAKAAAAMSRGRAGKRKSDIPPPHELLASPNFKLYLYSCKMCRFKCNAIKEMSAHKASEHSNGSRVRNGRTSTVTLQCARCPFRGAMHSQLMKHVQEKHLRVPAPSNTVNLDTKEVEAADVLVCGACGFESSSRNVFRKHIEEEHGATTC